MKGKNTVKHFVENKMKRKRVLKKQNETQAMEIKKEIPKTGEVCCGK